MRIYAIPPVMIRRSCITCLRRAGSLLLMVTVWAAFFVWGVTMTQMWLTALANPFNNGHLVSWQATLVHFLQTDAGIFLPAILLVFVSLALFFYRVPRVKGRLSVPIEFALTTLLFISVNLIVMQVFHFLAYLFATLTAESNAVVTNAGAAQGLILTEISISITLVMLAYLFWLQWSGRLLMMWRRRQRGAAVR